MRKTITHTVEYRGVGIHTGEACAFRLHPGDGSGIKFLINDIIIPAHLSFKCADTRCTTLGRDGITIMTVEHLLAALYAFDIDDCIIEMRQGKEIPIGDGSALPFCALLREAGISQTEGEPDIVAVKKSVTYAEGEVSISVTPSHETRITFLFDGSKFEYPSQRESIVFTQETFEREIAPARTFGFWQEIALLRGNGFAAGGSFENALVIKDGLPYNTEYRMTNEPVRHKILDFVGDIALIGKRVRGDFIAERSGHFHNNRFALQLSGQL